MHLTVLAHGSPDPRHARDVGALVARLERSGTPAAAAYLDHDGQRPTVVAAELAGRGVERTTVVPLLVAPAFHVRVDVPAAVAAMRCAAGPMSVASAEAVGLHPMILDAAAELIRRAGVPLGPRTGVIVAFTGTRDTRALAAINALVRSHGSALADRLGVRRVGAAFLDGGRPVGRTRTLMRCVDGCTDFVGVTAMIADGILRDRLVGAAELAGVPVVPGTLADTETLARLVQLRASDAIGPALGVPALGVPALGVPAVSRQR